VIPPRPGDSAGDPTLVAGVLGAVASLRALRALLAELADDGDRGAEDPASDAVRDVVDVVLGLAALADAIERRLPDPPATALAAAPASEAREPIDLAVQELLR
jgi:hypothetical protein